MSMVTSASEQDKPKPIPTENRHLRKNRSRSRPKSKSQDRRALAGRQADWFIKKENPWTDWFHAATKCIDYIAWRRKVQNIKVTVSRQTSGNHGSVQPDIRAHVLLMGNRGSIAHLSSCSWLETRAKIIWVVGFRDQCLDHVHAAKLSRYLRLTKTLHFQSNSCLQSP
jgi:hypothetical protein